MRDVNIERVWIENIPAVIWGENKEKVFIAVHGNKSNNEDKVIKILAKEGIKKGYSVLSFDLPKHGERIDILNYPCKVQNCIKDLDEIMKYAKEKWKEISLFACSMGAYFSLIQYKEEDLKEVLFLSPVVNMERIIENMMKWFDISEKRLEFEKEVQTPIGEKLYFDYYTFVKSCPIKKWDKNTSILYGEKDKLCEFEIINKFSEDYNCDLVLCEEAEHFFHNEKEINFYKEWLGEKIY